MPAARLIARTLIKISGVVRLVPNRLATAANARSTEFSACDITKFPEASACRAASVRSRRIAPITPNILSRASGIVIGNCLIVPEHLITSCSSGRHKFCWFADSPTG